MAFNMDDGGDDFGGSDLAEINITPFVDVVLVLLIIFMVSAPFAVSGVKVDLPKSKTTKALKVKSQPVILTVSRDGRYFLGKKELKADTLVESLKGVRGSDENFQLFIRGDGAGAYNAVYYAINTARAAGIQKIGLLGEKGNRK